MQLSRQLNGILESSEQLVTTFGSSLSTTVQSTSLFSSSTSVPFGVPQSYTASVNSTNLETFDGPTPGGRSSPLTGQSSPGSSTIAQQDTFTNQTPLFKRSVTPNSTHSATYASSYVRELEILMESPFGQ
ncbi:unnamed protein product [Echinostoma caproni]|uniref:Uncharacterized protein n=1 Tax=Echinostoma caproni TaxID=27848 RepID=A0A183A2V2_9TREM|nr:unnamed protein product [Echinostoma caproni]